MDMTVRRILMLLLALAVLVCGMPAPSARAAEAGGSLDEAFAEDEEASPFEEGGGADASEADSEEAVDEVSDEVIDDAPESTPEPETTPEASPTPDLTGAVAQNITAYCRFKASEGNVNRALDGKVTTGWTYDHVGAWIGFQVPDGVLVGGFSVEWEYDPVGISIEEYDADRNLLRTRDQSCTFAAIVSNYPLLLETRYVVMRMTAAGQRVDELYVYSAGEISARVQIWDAPPEKADLMVVSTHQDDELIYLGGTIPYYAVAKQRPTVVVYMADCGRYRRKEALNGLWAMGYRNFPIFLNLKDERIGSFDETLAHWGGKTVVLGLLVAQIRRFKPEVIVCQDINGEYGHNQHKITARALYYAVQAAADPQYYPETAEWYGVWQVKKLYNHLYPDHQIKMDWQTPLAELGGYSPLQMAQRGYQEHASQHDYFQVVAGGQYDNSRFGLRITTVGWDEVKNDFFEHIPDPEPEATPEPLITEQPLRGEADEAGGEDLSSGEKEPSPSEGEEGERAEDGGGAGLVATRADAASTDEGADETAGDGAIDETVGDGAAGEDAAARFMPEVTPLMAEPTPMPAPTRAPADEAAPSRVMERNGGWILPAVGLVGAGAAAGVALRALDRATGRRRRRKKR